MIYLASPLSHPDPAIQEQRVIKAIEVAAHLFREGISVFSPIAHSYGFIRQHPDLAHPDFWCRWVSIDLKILVSCDALWVLILPGWDQSQGVRQELQQAFRLGIPVDGINERYEISALQIPAGVI